MKRLAVISIILNTIILSGCSTDEQNMEATNDKEYIIISRDPSNSQDQKYFQAIDIRSKKSTPIFGIVETTGDTYIATMSRFPECNKKILQGYISSDYDFVTTKIVRDTTVPTVGQ